MQKKQSDNPRSEIGGVLTKYEIEKYGLIKRLTEAETFESIDSDKIQATTYDLCVGEAHIVYNENEPEKIYIGDDNERLELFSADNFKRQDEIKMEKLTIAPYGSALIQLDEIIDTYSVYNTHTVLIVGRFDLKLHNVSQGLISQQATQVEPFYKGRLFCYIHNLSSKPHILSFGEPFATIEFLYVSKLNNSYQQKNLIEILEKHNNEKYNNHHCLKENNTYLGIKDIRYFLHSSEDISENFGISHLGKDGVEAFLEKNFDRLVKKVEEKINLRLRIISVLLPIIFAILTIFAPSLTDYLSKVKDFFSKNTNGIPNSTLDQSVSSDILKDEGTE